MDAESRTPFLFSRPHLLFGTFILDVPDAQKYYYRQFDTNAQKRRKGEPTEPSDAKPQPSRSELIFFDYFADSCVFM